MSEAQKLELLRLRLKKQMQEEKWEENFVTEIVLIAKEMGVSVNEILEWTIMKYNVVSAVIRDFYEEQKRQIEYERSAHTLR